LPDEGLGFDSSALSASLHERQQVIGVSVLARAAAHVQSSPILDCFPVVQLFVVAAARKFKRSARGFWAKQKPEPLELGKILDLGE